MTVGNINTFIASALTQSPEQSITLNSTAATDSATGTGAQYNVCFTLPTAYKFVAFTGIEWKNGTVVSGNMMSGIDLVDANPPVLAAKLNVALGQETAATGTSTVQRVSLIKSSLVQLSNSPVFTAWTLSSGATTRLITTTGSPSINIWKSIAYTVATPQQENAAWNTNTVYPYMKVYYVGYS